MLNDSLCPEYLNFIINPIDDCCNLNCRYCYSKQNIRGGRADYCGIRDLPILKWFPILLKALNSLSSLKMVTFTWHGGEPLLLSNEFYLQIVKMQRKSLVERLNFNNVIQTNGTLLPKDRALFLTQMGFDIGISIDGPEFKHNDQRFVDEASFNQLKSRLLTLAKPIPFAVFLVIHEGNVDSGKEILSFLRNLAPQNGVSFIPRFNRDSHLDPKQYSDFLIDLFDLWWPERLPYIALFENFITGLEGQLPRFCFLNDGCAAFVSLDSGGTVYATCQPREEVKVGSIGENGFRELILRHRSTVKRIIGGIRSESLGLRLGVDSPSFFPGKGCPKRLVGNRDPYVDTFAEVIKHIGKRLGLEVLDDGQKR